jgi:hypothetical protein
VGPVSAGVFHIVCNHIHLHHDAPVGFTLSGQTKEKSDTCPVCVDGTASVYLPSSRKLVYMRHRRFLPRKHKYRKIKMHFDNTVEKDSASKQYTRKLVFEIVKNIKVVFGKGTLKGQKRKKTPTLTDIPFKKQSIFFQILFLLEGPSNLSQH